MLVRTIFVILVLALLTSCAPATTPAIPPPMAETATSALPLPSPTLQPSDTPSPSDTPPPADQPVGDTLVAQPTMTSAITTVAASPLVEATSALHIEPSILPQEGVWSGGATGLILSFRLYYEGGQPMLTDLAILWLGPGECMVDHLLSESTPIQGTEFTRFYNKDELRYQLRAEIESPTLISGVLDLRYTGCGERKFVWRAAPAASITPGP